jgi:hypothetical protein
MIKNYGMRVRYEIQGGHAHARIFVGSYPADGRPNDFTFGLAGKLCMSIEELEAWRESVAHAQLEAPPMMSIEFLEDDR